MTVEEIEQKLSTLNLLKEQQKKLFILIIKRFIEVLSEHLTNNEMKTEESSPHWLKWTSERLEDIFMTVS